VNLFTVGPKRARRPRLGELRVFVGTLRAGVLRVARGSLIALIDKAGDRVGERRDTSKRLLKANGDRVLVSSPDVLGDPFAVAIATIVGCRADGWDLVWNVELSNDSVRDGRVFVQPLRPVRRNA
jgi:hypothetical protein